MNKPTQQFEKNGRSKTAEFREIVAVRHLEFAVMFSEFERLLARLYRCANRSERVFRQQASLDIL